MKDKDYTLLLTGTFNVNRRVPFLSITDKKKREDQYIEALLFYIHKCKIRRIVFCENSGERCPEIIKKAVDNNKIEFEWLSFKANVEKTIRYGKSYGESEIIEYALENSRLIKSTGYFIKITGRLVLRNYRRIVPLLSKKHNYFMAYGKDEIEMVDTRLFAIKYDDFRKHFNNEYVSSLTEQNKSIERLYANIINNKKIDVLSFPLKVCFEGISGGYGLPYNTSKREEVIASIKRILHLLCGDSLVIEPVNNWQADMIFSEEIWNQYFSKFTGKKIVICGAGRIGRRMYDVAKKKSKVLAWADKDNESIKRINGQKILSYKKACKKDRKVDYYLLCVKSIDSYNEIKKILQLEIKNDDKIYWCMDFVSGADNVNYFLY